jgi:hypothetical protein
MGSDAEVKEECRELMKEHGVTVSFDTEDTDLVFYEGGEWTL